MSSGANGDKQPDTVSQGTPKLICQAAVTPVLTGRSRAVSMGGAFERNEYAMGVIVNNTTSTGFCLDSAIAEMERHRRCLESRWKEVVCSQFQSIAVDLAQEPPKTTFTMPAGRLRSPILKCGDIGSCDDEYLRYARRATIGAHMLKELAEEDISEPESISKSLSFISADGDPSLTDNDGDKGFNIQSEVSALQRYEVNDHSPISTPLVHTIPRYQIGDLPCYFRQPPTKVLLVKRLGSPNVTVEAAKICNFLSEERRVTLYVESHDFHELTQMGARNVIPFTSPDKSGGLPHLDFVIAMGGDGTLLWVSNLFPNAVPPVLSVFMGSLGYLAQFAVEDVGSAIDTVMHERFTVQLRCRLRASVCDANGEEIAEYVAMNDCVMDRGGCSQLTYLDVYCDGFFFTTVAADGLVVATPTGSTAYSMSAGGSMVHPKVPSMLFTPICPHSLSFRPVILPDSVVLKIHNHESSRASAWLSVDGRSRTEISKGMHVLISMSAFPIPLIVSKNTADDPWLTSLKRILNWNHKIRHAVYPLEVHNTSRNVDANLVASVSPRMDEIDRIHLSMDNNDPYAYDELPSKFPTTVSSGNCEVPLSHQPTGKRVVEAYDEAHGDERPQHNASSTNGCVWNADQGKVANSDLPNSGIGCMESHNNLCGHFGNSERFTKAVEKQKIDLIVVNEFVTAKEQVAFAECEVPIRDKVGAAYKTGKESSGMMNRNAACSSSMPCLQGGKQFAKGMGGHDRESCVFGNLSVERSPGNVGLVEGALAAGTRYSSSSEMSTGDVWRKSLRPSCTASVFVTPTAEWKGAVILETAETSNINNNSRTRKSQGAKDLNAQKKREE